MGILKSAINIFERFICGSDKGIDAMAYWPNKQDHENKGGTICPSCNKKFITSFRFCTMDVVFKFDHPERLSTTEAYCPHCRHSFELCHTPFPKYQIK